MSKCDCGFNHEMGAIEKWTTTMSSEYEELYSGAYVKYDSNGKPSILTDPLNFSLDEINQNSLDIYEIPLVLHMTILQYNTLGQSWVDDQFDRLNKIFGATLGTESSYLMPNPRDVDTFPAVGEMPRTPSILGTPWMYNNTGANNDGYIALTVTGSQATLAIDWPTSLNNLNNHWASTLSSGSSFGGYRYILEDSGPSAIEILNTTGATIADRIPLDSGLVTLGNNSGKLDYIAIISSTDIFTSEPVVTVSGNSIVRAVIDYTKGEGKLSRIDIVDGGSNYLPNINPIVTITGATNTIIKAYAGLGNISLFAREFNVSEQNEINSKLDGLSSTQKTAIELQTYIQLRFKNGHNVFYNGAEILFTDTTLIREQLSEQFNVPKGKVTDYDYNHLVGQPKIKFVPVNNKNIDLTENGTPKTIIVSRSQKVGFNDLSYSNIVLGGNNEYTFAVTDHHYEISAYLTAAHGTPVSLIPISNGVAVYDKVLVRTMGVEGPATLTQYDFNKSAIGGAGWENGLDFMEMGILGDNGYKYGRPWFKATNTYYRSDPGMETYGYPDVASIVSDPTTGGENNNPRYTTPQNYDKFVRRFMHVQIYSGDYGVQGQFGGYARFPYPFHVSSYETVTSQNLPNTSPWAMYKNEYNVLMLRFFQGICHLKDTSTVAGILSHELGHVLGLYHTFSPFTNETGDKIWDTPIAEQNTTFSTTKSTTFGNYLRPANQAVREDGTRIVTIENDVMSYNNNKQVFFTKEQSIQMRRVLKSYLKGYINFISYPQLSILTDSEGLVKYPVEYIQPSSKRTPFYTQNARKVELGASYLQDLEYNRLSGGSIQATHINSDYLYTDNAQIVNCRIKGSLELERGVGKFVALQTNNFATNIITITSKYTILNGDHTIVATTGTNQIILPLSSSVRAGAVFVFKNASVNTWSLTCSGSDTLDSPAVVPRDIVPGESIQVQNLGKNGAWYIIGNYVPP